MSESWKKVFHEGFAPSFTIPQLQFLRALVANNQESLIQGGTCVPEPLACVLDFPVESACFVAAAGVYEHDGFGHATVEEVENFFARACYECDERLGEPLACRWFLNYFDETPREHLLAELLPELDKAIASKQEFPF